MAKIQVCKNHRMKKKQQLLLKPFFSLSFTLILSLISADIVNRHVMSFLSNTVYCLSLQIIYFFIFLKRPSITTLLYLCLYFFNVSSALCSFMWKLKCSLNSCMWYFSSKTCVLLTNHPQSSLTRR